jgi:MFS family permease
VSSTSSWWDGYYVRYWTATAVSGLGSQLSVLAFPLLVLSLGGNAVQAGAVASCSLITRTVLRLPGGHLADRFNRGRLMLAMDLIRFAAVGSIPLAAGLGRLHYPQLLVVAVIEGVATSVFSPAASVSLRDVVPAEKLTAALSQSQATYATISLLGPVLGGALFGVDRILPFTIDALSYGAAALLRLGIPFRSHREGGTEDKRMTAGLAWLWHQANIMRVLLFASVLNLVGAAAEVAVLIGLRERGASGPVIGVVMACAGVGGIVGALLAERIIALLSEGVLYAVVGVAWTAATGSFVFVERPWAIGVVLVILLLFAPAAGIKLGQLTLGTAPPHILGRVSTAEQTFSISLASVGPILAGASLQALGSRTTWSILAVLCALSAAVAAVPLIRRSDQAPPPAAPPTTPVQTSEPAAETNS